MTAKVPESILDKAEELYKQGLSFREISEIVGRGDATLRKRLKERGVQIRKTSQGRSAPNAITKLPELQICENYKNGESENSISKKYNISRSVVRRILLKHSINPRDQSQSELLKWSRMTSNQRENQVKKAHEANIGIVRGDETKRKVAIARERNTPRWYIGCGEPEFKEWLNEKGIQYQYQKAVEFYNVDFLIDGVAIELTSFVGRNRLTRCDFIKRASILNSHGIKTLAVEFKNKDDLLSHAHDVISMVNKLKSGVFPAHYVAYRLQFKEPDIRILA